MRTLSEALRLAAAELLDTDPRDVRATAELPAAQPVIILSDAVPGGAGYCRRLLGDDEPRFSARMLIGRRFKSSNVRAEKPASRAVPIASTISRTSNIGTGLIVTRFGAGFRM